jgi:hypothetical protein
MTPTASSEAGKEAYETIADKVGFLPNVRKADNLYQLKFVGYSVLGAAVLFCLIPMGDSMPLIIKMLLGAVAGMFLGLIVSGAILAIRNLKR